MENINSCKGPIYLPAVTSDNPVVMRRPLILGAQKWNSIRGHLRKTEEAFLIAETERKYQEYLQEGSRELTRKWPNLIQKSGGSKQTLAERKKEIQDAKLLEGEKEFKKIKENSERMRQEHIAKAQHMIARQKPGPRDLESAAILCEVLKGREIQSKVNAEFNKSMQEYRQKEDARMEAEAIPYIEEEQRKIVDNRRRNEEYKNELIKTIKEEERSRVENNKRQKEFERKIREQADKDLQAQIERERAVLQRKKEAMRKSALEAMKMVEQRRLRDKLENEIDNQIIAIFTKGKHCIDNIKKDKEKQLRKEKVKKIELNAQRIWGKMPNSEALEEQRLQKAIEEMTAKLDQQEREKIQKEKMMKAARIKYYMEELEKKKMLKVQECEKYRWELANRLKNEEVNEDFERQRAQDRIKKGKEIKAALFEQMNEKQLREKHEKEFDQRISNIPCDDNKLFLQYADKLVEHAKNKSRPILPLLKAVEKYKKENEIDLERKEPRHLKSNIPINERQSCSAKNSGQPIIKYDLNELKQLNPRASPRAPLWA